MRGRFAPSPTGHLHLGNVRSALLGWLQARSLGGEFHLRIEDLDPERSKQQFIDSIRSDLEFLGLTWDGPVLRQSERRGVYDEALVLLNSRGKTYPCTCSRADIARAVAAPHVGEEGPIYPRTCASGVASPGKPACVRFRVMSGVPFFEDALAGPCSQDVEHEVGDFVIRRADGIASYQLAVVVDDIASGITHVLRGADLLTSTARQLQLYDALAATPPQYAHVPLVVEPDGKRLAKRDGALTLNALRSRGVSAERILGLLARWSGLGAGGPVTARELLDGFSLEKIAKAPAVVHEGELVFT